MIKENHPDKAIFTFGHSMGGLITFVYALVHPERNMKGQVFSGPALAAPWGLYKVPMTFMILWVKPFQKQKFTGLLREELQGIISILRNFKMTLMI